MRHYLIILLLLSFNNLTFSMDQEIPLSTLKKNESDQPKQMKSKGELIDIISKEIDKEYPYTGLLLSHLLVPKNLLLNSLTIIQRRFKFITPDDDFIDNLSKKNKLFEKAISEYTKDALKNFNNVTCDTLHSINDPLEEQPTPELNQLPIAIKKYVMAKAYSQLEYEYDITLTSNNKFTTAAICSAAHLAFTTHADGSGILWSLTTGKAIRSLPAKTFNGSVETAFNNTGSQIATANRDTENNTITIYSPRLTKLFSINPKYQIYRLEYLKNSQACTLCAYTHIYGRHSAELWSIDEHQAISLGIISSLIAQRPLLIDGDYSIFFDPSTQFFHDNLLSIKKRHNNQPVYLCMQAMKQTKNRESIKGITTSPSFIRTTEYEKNSLKAEIEKRISTSPNKQTANK